MAFGYYGFDFGGYPQASRLFNKNVVDKAKENYTTGMEQFQNYELPVQAAPQPVAQSTGLEGYAQILGKPGQFATGTDYNRPGTSEYEMLQRLGIRRAGDMVYVPKGINTSDFYTNSVLQGLLGEGYDQYIAGGR